jgi:hypothetical protein
MSMPMHVEFEGKQAARAEQVSDEIQANIQAHVYNLESLALLQLKVFMAVVQHRLNSMLTSSLQIWMATKCASR